MHKFWTFRAAKDKKDEGDLLLYGPIARYTWWGDEVTPKQFRADLDALGDVKRINIFINSEGGDVFAAQAIRSVLARHNAEKIGYVDGLAASAATFILTACDKVIMPINAMLYYHNPMAGAFGFYYAEELLKMSADLEALRGPMIAEYKAQTGLDEDKIKEILDVETLMTAEEAVKLGFADEIEQEKKIAAFMFGGITIINGLEMDLSRYKHPPKLAAKPPEPELKPASSGDEEQQTLLSHIQADLSIMQMKGAVR